MNDHITHGDEFDQPPFRWVPGHAKPGVSARVWGGVGSVLLFYVVLGVILVEIFRPSWIHHMLRVVTGAP